MGCRRWCSGDRTFAARELAALILIEARERAQNFLRQPVHRAVLTLPPTRKDEPLSKAMSEAAALAGLHVERLISEPTAVALGAFGRHKGKPERTAMVIDWGGGRFQASLVRYAPRQCQVLGTEGNVALCGAELDKRLLDLLLRKLPSGVKVAADANNPAALYRVAGRRRVREDPALRADGGAGARALRRHRGRTSWGTST